MSLKHALRYLMHTVLVCGYNPSIMDCIAEFTALTVGFLCCNISNVFFGGIISKGWVDFGQIHVCKLEPVLKNRAKLNRPGK